MRILVVEDQEKLANSIKKGLEYKGFAVDAVFDGAAAQRRLDLNGHTNFDLIILDIMLPFVDGLTICKNLRSKNVSTPILMLTAKDTLENKVEGLNIGADDYLVKPFALEELIARVNALLRRPQEAISTELNLSGITLNITTRKVFKNDKEVTLTTKEFAILEQFMRHPNEAMTREKIMSHVWDFAFEGFSNVVDVHIKNLRKKLQKKNENIFETVHGVGYRFKS